MGNRHWRKPVVPSVVFVIFVLGCNRSDQNHLARAAGKAREKINSASGESGRGLTTGWQSMALDARVSARLRWDKTLSNEQILVQATGGVIELKGTVRDLIQRHAEYTGSTYAAGILRDWIDMQPRLVKIMPRDYKRVLLAEAQARAEGRPPTFAELVGTSGG